MEELAIFHENSDVAPLVSSDDLVQFNTTASPSGTDDSAAANRFWDSVGQSCRFQVQPPTQVNEP